MKISNYLLLILLLSSLLVSCVGSEVVTPPITPTPTIESVALERPWRIFLLRSYGEDHLASNRMRSGILEALARGGYSTPADTLELAEMALDLSPAVEEVPPELITAAIEAISEFEPDLVMVLDDEAARSVIPIYPDSTLPFVFTGLDGTPDQYALALPNVTGVLEHPYPEKTIQIAQRMGRQRDLLILGDQSLPVGSNAEALAAQLEASEELDLRQVITRETDDWEEWQLLVLEEASNMDFILLLRYQTLETDWGGQISEQSVLNWTLKNSPIPVFGLWLQTVQNGAVGGLVISTYAQGQLAGEMALEIAAGRSPAGIPVSRPQNNILAINAGAADYWNMKIPLEFLITARIERQFPIPVGGW